MKRLLVTFIVLSAAFTLAIAQEDSVVVHKDSVVVAKSFGYLSYDEVVKMSPGYDEAQQTVASLRDAYERELERSEEVFSKQFSEYVDGQKTFPENILLKRQNELRQTMEQSLQFKREAKALLDEKEKEVMDALHVEVDRAIRAIGLERGYAFVLNTDGHACPFINVDLGEDITGLVLQRLKNKQ